jgi:hypothetical protein
MELRSTVHEMKTELETLRKQRHDEEQAVDGGVLNNMARTLAATCHERDERETKGARGGGKQ